jgi:hypothetical protein
MRDELYVEKEYYMILITYVNTDKAKAESDNQVLCQALAGWDAFINNEVCISSVKNIYDDKYGFDIFIGPEPAYDVKSIPFLEVNDVDEAYRNE